MDWYQGLFIRNFILICVAIVMVVNAIQRYKQHPRISVYSILIMGCTLTLAFAGAMELYSKSIGNSYLALTFAILGYALRPACIYLFILLSKQFKIDKLFHLTYLPLIINLLIYCLAYIPAVSEYIVRFPVGDDGTCSFVGGPLRFTSHVISACYLGWLAYIALSMLRRKHLTRGLTVLGCAVFVIAAVVLESFFNDGDIYLLNSTIAVCALIYYLYLYIEKTQIDTLTGLFNRETYYIDSHRLAKSITGVIQFDMNGLRYINDNLGHLEGDKALSNIAKIISECADKRMYIYRLGGDEFLIFAVDCDKESIVNTVNEFKNRLSATTYHCSVGYAIKGETGDNAEELMRAAEKYMYLDKAEFYKSSGIERRKL